LKGSNFCVAAKDALSLVWCNADRYALVSSIGGAFIFIGKLFISSLTTFFCYLILSKNDPWKTDLNSYILPCLVTFKFYNTNSLSILESLIIFPNFLNISIKNRLYSSLLMLLALSSWVSMAWVCQLFLSASSGMRKYFRTLSHHTHLPCCKSSSRIKRRNKQRNEWTTTTWYLCDWCYSKNIFVKFDLAE